MWSRCLDGSWRERRGLLLKGYQHKSLEYGFEDEVKTT